MTATPEMSSRLVTVIVPALRPSAFPLAAVQSVVDQAHLAIELVVVAGEGRQNAGESLRPFLDRQDIRSRFRRVAVVPHTGPDGVAAAINTGLRHAEGEFINVLGEHDVFPRSRFSSLLKVIGQEREALAFARVELRPLPQIPPSGAFRDEAGYAQNLQDEIPFFPTVGYAMFRAFCPLSTGNLFFTRQLAEALGGFAAYEQAYGWDFGLRSVLLTEPVFVPEPLHTLQLPEGYFSRLGANELRENDAVLRSYLFLCRNRVLRNPYAPSTAWGPFFKTFVEVTGYKKHMIKP